MASAQRVSDEPAFILHRYDWSESSLILEVFTRHRGRVALVAKGAKKHTSNFRPVLLRLLARDDPYAYVFDVYAALIKLLATQHDVVQEPALRAFELILLRELGLLPSLHAQTQTLQPLAPQAPYALAPEVGLRPAEPGERAVLTGQQWHTLETALRQEPHSFAPILQACAHLAPALKPQLRTLLQFHCGSPMLRTRQLMMDLQAL